MTKYEWESELKKNIHRLPDEEIGRVLEYYDELFADKIERGYSESEIVSQFGNPVDVADKILSDYDGELREDATVPPPVMHAPTAPPPETAAPRQETVSQNEPSAAPIQHTLHGGRLAVLIVALVLTGGLLFDLLAAFIITAAVLCGAGWVMFGSGIVGSLVSVVSMFRDFGAGIVQIGGCVAVCGLGILFGICFAKAVKGLIRLTAYIVRALSQWVYPKKEAQHA